MRVTVGEKQPNTNSRWQGRLGSVSRRQRSGGLSGERAALSDCSQAWSRGNAGGYVSALAAITKYHGPDGFSSRQLFLTVLEAGKSMIKVPADSVLGEGSPLGLQMAAFSL